METRIPQAAEAVRTLECRSTSSEGHAITVYEAGRHILTQWYSSEGSAAALRDMRTVSDCVRALFPDRVSPHDAHQADAGDFVWQRVAAYESVIHCFAGHEDTTLEDVRVVYEKAEQMIAEVVA